MVLLTSSVALLMALFCGITPAAATAESESVADVCCGAVSQWPECLQACTQLASLECSVTYEKRHQYLTSYCLQVPESVLMCLNSSNASSNPSPTPSPLITCCNQSSNHVCRATCIEQLMLGNLDEAALQRVAQSCGPPFKWNSDPVWACFLSKAPQGTMPNTTEPECAIKSVPDFTPGDWARVHCCLQANDSSCRAACIQEYTNRPIRTTLLTLAQCRNRPTEGLLETCLRDVDSQCKLGCTQQMTFCSNFNNRPLNLFRHCTDVASHHAKLHYTRWSTDGYITFPSLGVNINIDVVNCYPELWKLTACSLHVQPCDPSTHATVLCREDCLQLMGNCMSSSNSMTARKVCEALSPSYLQSTCVSLSQFLTPSMYTGPQMSTLTYPCDSNPCANGLNCTVNHNCHHNDQTCTPYTCVPTCSLSSRSHLALKGVASAHVALPVEEKDCFGYVARGGVEGVGCGYEDSVKAAYCEEKLLHCHHNGNEYTHGAQFHPDPHNFCICHYGRLICTSNELLVSPCNCPADYRPICINGRTIPNICYAVCLGYSQEGLLNGDCASIATCSSHSCQPGTRCMPKQQTCLSGQNITNEPVCSQYVCESSAVSCNGVTQEPVCDQSGKEHASMCALLLTNEQMDYTGYCQKECSRQRRRAVCGVDGQTYQSSCHSEAARVAIDYIDSCRDLPKQASSARCTVKCPEMPIFNTVEQCVGSVPPGACCQQCGAMVRVLSDQQLLRRNTAVMQLTSVASGDIMSRLRRFINLVECDLYGHVLLDNSLSVLVLPIISNTTSNLTVHACNIQAQSLAALINTRSPVIASDPYLAHLVGANVHVATLEPVHASLTPSTLEPNGGSQTSITDHVILLMIVTALLAVHLLAGEHPIITRSR